MIDLYIFGFGMVVTLLVGSALTTAIVVKNRHLEASEAAVEQQSEPDGAHPRRDASGMPT